MVGADELELTAFEDTVEMPAVYSWEPEPFLSSLRLRMPLMSAPAHETEIIVR